LPNNLGILVLDRSSVAIKKGKSDGTTEVAHNFKPDFAADRLLLENNNKHNVKIRKIIERKFLFILKINIFIVFFFIWTPLINLYEDKTKIELNKNLMNELIIKSLYINIENFSNVIGGIHRTA
jgi:hypothetical protein